MALWTPAQITAALWLQSSDASTITIDTGVSEWRDKSGNSRSPANTTDANQPALISAELNGLDIVRFDGSNDYLLFPGSTATNYALKFSTASFSILAFIKPSSLAPAQNIFFGSRGYDVGWFAGFATDDPYLRMYSGGERWSPAPMSAITATTTWQSFVVTAPRGATGKYRKNGTTLQSTTSAVGAQSLSNALQVRLGSYVDGSNNTAGPFSGDIAEILLIEGVVTDEIIWLFEGYAHWRYGCQGDLSADHPYKLAAPTIPDVTIRAILDQPYNLIADLVRPILDQTYHITNRQLAALVQVYGLRMLAVLAQHYGDAKSITKFLEQYYSSSRSIIKILEQVYGKEIRTIAQLQQAFTLIGNIVASSEHSYSITEQIIGAPLKLSQNYNLELLNSIVSGLRQNWNITSNILLNNTVDYKITISGVQVPSENVNVNCDIEQHYIEGTFTLHKPDYFPLCIKKANVVITITVGSYTIDFHLLLWEKTRTTTVNSTIYTLTCRSQSVLLDSKYSPTLQKEFPANLASTTVAELAAIHNIPVNWNVYESGQLVDELIPAGYLFANNEKPLAVIRKILEPLGAIMQSTPAGGLEIMHVYPKKVPSYQTETIDIDLKEDIRYENVSTTSEERSGVNTVYVSDQLTANSTYNLEEEEVSSISKYVKGFHTPWDSEEVYLDTSGGTSVLIEYLGVVIENMPLAGSEVPYELIEFVNGTGHVSKPIYARNTIEWVMDSLGGITFAEDGTLTSEIPGESLLKIAYTTKYHKWLVTSPTIKDVQCVLRPVHE